MQRLQVIEEEMLPPVLMHGFARLGEVDAVILTPDGSLSVLQISGERGSARR